MSKYIKSNLIFKNVGLSLGAQVISLIISLITGLLVPAFISEYDYSYWQIFLLYSSYVGILHFGLLDGIVLRYSKYDYEELDKDLVSSQFEILLSVLSLFSLIIVAIGALKLTGDFIKVAIFVSVEILIKNASTYSSYLLQITNRIDKYVIVTISCRVIYGLAVIVLLVCKVSNFVYYCAAELLGESCAVVVASSFNKNLYFSKGNPFCAKVLNELKVNVASGIMLMFANWSSSLLVGGAKMIIQWRWDELVFGKVAFAFSLSAVFLQFITSISVVLFPSLKRMDEKNLPEMYEKLRNGTSIFLFFALALFFPFCKMLNTWMPKYKESLVFLGIFLPNIIFLAKINLLTNNYFKAYREEKKMMLINVSTTAIAFLAYLFSAYVLSDMTVLLYLMVVIIMLRTIISEITVGKIIGKSFTKEYFIEAILSFLFIIIVDRFSLITGFLLYMVALGACCFAYRIELKSLMNQLR